MHLVSAYPSDIAVARAMRGQRDVISVVDLAALKALKSRPEVVIVETGQAKGVWQWALGDSTTADDGTVVECTSGTAGRYKRIYDGPVYATWFGASPSASAAVNTAAIEAALQATGDVFVPAGEYTIAGIDLPEGASKLAGAGKDLTSFVLASGSNRSAIVSPLTQQTFGPYEGPTLQGFFLNANGNNQTGTSHGIELTDATFSLGTRYGSGAFLTDVHVESSKDNNLYVGSNRNAGNCTDGIFKYSIGTCVASAGYDWRWVRGEMGGSGSSHGLNVGAGGGVVFFGTNIYSNDLAGVTVSSSVTNYVDFIGCSVDLNGRQGYVIAGGAATRKVSIVGGRIGNNSAESDGTYAAVTFSASGSMNIIDGTMFEADVTQSSYLVEFVSGAAGVQFFPLFDSGSPPYATAITNDFTKINVTSEGQLTGLTVGAGTKTPQATLHAYNTTNNANAEAVRFSGHRSAPADNDTAYASLRLADDGGNDAEFARLGWQATDVNVGTGLDGRLVFSTVNGGSMTQALGLQVGLMFPFSNDGIALGTGALSYSDLFLASGGAINWSNSTYTITQSSATLAFSGAATFGQWIGTGAPVTKTADFTVADTENDLINNKSGSACVVTLPAASSYTGRSICFQNYQAQQLNSNASNVVPLGGGAAGTAILSANAGRWARLKSNGTNWVIVEGVV